MNLISDETELTEKKYSFSENALQNNVVIINIKKITAILYYSMLLLVAASMYGDYMELTRPANDRFVMLYMNFFNLAREQNLPTLYSTFLLFAASVLNFFIFFTPATLLKKSAKWYWLLLGIIFIFLGMDEMLQIHDRLNYSKPLIKLSDGNEFLYYAWVIPYSPAVLVMGLVFLRFVLSLPKPIRKRILIAAFVYVGGALGFEFPESYIHVNYGMHGVTIAERILYTIEETMEMTGVIIFINALLRYISMQKIKIEFANTSAQ